MTSNPRVTKKTFGTNYKDGEKAPLLVPDTARNRHPLLLPPPPKWNELTKVLCAFSHGIHTH